MARHLLYTYAMASNLVGREAEMTVAVTVGGQTLILEDALDKDGVGDFPDRSALVQALREDLRLGVSPYLRLHRAHAWLSLAPRGPAQLEELRFVESLFGVLLGASGWAAEERLQGVDCSGSGPMGR
jgi:hypothetical protein